MKWAAGGGVWQRRLHTAVAAQDRQGQSVRDRRLSVAAAQMCRVAERRNGFVARIVRLGGHVIAPSREPIERWNARRGVRIRLYKLL